MKGFRVICFVVQLFLMSHLQVMAQHDNLHREISVIIQHDANINFDIVPGILVGVIDGDSTYVSSFGEQLSPDSLYELGSVTKPFVFWLVKQAMDSLNLRMDDSICQFIPDSICKGNINQLSIDQVLQHRSGLPRWPPNMGEYADDEGMPYATYDGNQLADDLIKMKSSPDTFLYSHVGYALFYWLFEEVGGLSEFSREQFIRKLKLLNTGWSVNDDLIAQGYGMDGRPQPSWHSDALSTAFGLKSDLNDVLYFIRYISSEVSAEEIPSFKDLKKEIKKLSKKDEYVLADGWFVVPSGTSMIYFHTGRTGGHHVSVAFIPELTKGVVVISNSSLGSNDLALRVLEMIKRAKG